MFFYSKRWYFSGSWLLLVWLITLPTQELKPFCIISQPYYTHVWWKCKVKILEMCSMWMLSIKHWRVDRFVLEKKNWDMWTISGLVMLSILLVLLLLLVTLVLLQQYFGMPVLAQLRAILYMEDVVWHGLGKSPSTHILNSEKSVSVDTWNGPSLVAAAVWVSGLVWSGSSCSFFVIYASGSHTTLAHDALLIMSVRVRCTQCAVMAPSVVDLFIILEGKIF